MLAVLITGPLVEQLIVTGLISGSAYALLGVSFGIVYSTTRIFHLANAAVYTFAAYGAALTVKYWGIPLVPALVIGLAVGVVSGAVIELVAYRPMRARGGTLLTVFLMSLGLTIASQNSIQLAFGAATVPLPGFPTHTVTVGTVAFTTLDLTQVVVSWLAIGCLIMWLRRTRYGHAISAVRSNKDMALAIGISVERIFVLVFVLGSLLAGIAALFFAMDSVAYPAMGTQPILYSFIAVFLGGVESLPGAAFGGLVVGLAASLTTLFLSGNYSPVVVFGLLYLLLLVRPSGLFGRAKEQNRSSTSRPWVVRPWRSSMRPE